MSSPCKQGYISREGYTKKNGIVVKAKCIKSTSVHGIKAEDITTPMIKEMLRKQKLAEKATSDKSPKKCPEGTIRRTAYVKKSYEAIRKDANGTPIKRISVKQTVVPAACIKDQGEKGKGLYDPKTGERVYVVVEKYLGENGYHDIKNKTAAERHAILDNVYSKIGKNWLSLFRTLNYLAVVNKNRKKIHDIFVADRNYIKRKYGSESS